MSDDKNKEESVIELAKRVGSKEAARIITEQKAKLKQEKGFEKTGQYYLRSQPVENKAKHLAIDMTKDTKPEKPVDSQFECFGCSS